MAQYIADWFELLFNSKMYVDDNKGLSLDIVCNRFMLGFWFLYPVQSL